MLFSWVRCFTLLLRELGKKLGFILDLTKIEGEMEARMKRASKGTETLVLSSRGKLVGFSRRKIRLWALRKSTIKSIS